MAQGFKTYTVQEAGVEANMLPAEVRSAAQLLEVKGDRFTAAEVDKLKQIRQQMKLMNTSSVAKAIEALQLQYSGDEQPASDRPTPPDSTYTDFSFAGTDETGIAHAQETQQTIAQTKLANLQMVGMAERLQEVMAVKAGRDRMDALIAGTIAPASKQEADLAAYAQQASGLYDRVLPPFVQAGENGKLKIDFAHLMSGGRVDPAQAIAGAMRSPRLLPPAQ